jgi:hypothetical protein
MIAEKGLAEWRDSIAGAAIRLWRRRKKMAPCGARFQEAKNGGQSGKAIQEAVPPARTAFCEVTLFVEESEGHTQLRPLSTYERCICRAKARILCDQGHTTV